MGSEDMGSEELSVVVWNVEWRRSASADGRELSALIQACRPDIACITEGYPDFLDLPYRVESAPDYGYPLVDSRRKVLLWSRHPWLDADPLGDDGLPSGRYAGGRTSTPLGDVFVHGICVPWQRAHVETGRRDRRPWEDHLLYLAGLRRVLEKSDRTVPTVVVGDYNQAIPRRRAPQHVYQALRNAFPTTIQWATEGVASTQGMASVDHLNHSSELMVSQISVLSNLRAEGGDLSDHFGLHLVLRRVSAPPAA
jgi:hypothetical protein